MGCRNAVTKQSLFKRAKTQVPITHNPEFRSCVKVEAAVLGFPS